MDKRDRKVISFFFMLVIVAIFINSCTLHVRFDDLKRSMRDELRAKVEGKDE